MLLMPLGMGASSPTRANASRRNAERSAAPAP